MIKHPLFVYTWPIIAIACELLVWPPMWNFLHTSNYSFDVSYVLNHLMHYVEIISTINLGKVYFSIAFFMLILSYVFWFKKPDKKTLLFTIFTTWGLCGIPGLLFVIVCSWHD